MIELELGLIISQEDYKGSVEELLREMAFEVVEKLDEVDISFDGMQADEIAIAIHQGQILIKHNTMPLFFINSFYTTRGYGACYKRLLEKTKRMLSISLDERPFGYSIHFDNKRQRRFIGTEEGIGFEGDEGEIQEEEKLYKTKNADNKITIGDYDYALESAGSELTYDVLINFCGKNIMEKDILFERFIVK